MKVLLLTNNFPSPQEPTRGMFNQHRLGSLSQYCETRLISPLPWWTRIKRPWEWIIAPKDDSSGISAAYPTYWSIPGYLSLHGDGMYHSLRRRLNRLRRGFPFEAILAAWAYPDAFAAARFAEEARLPLITLVMGSDINEFAEMPELRERIKWALKRSQRVIAVSSALGEKVKSLGVQPDRIVVQRNGVDGDQFRIRDKNASRRAFGLPEDRPILCYVGNLKEEKGPDVLISAMGFLKSRGREDILLMIVGGGPMESSLRSQANALGVTDQVLFCGRRPHREIPERIAAGDALCLPSHSEGCPNVVLEALASGRPVVASHVGGVPELLNAGNGIVVPPGNPETLAQALAEALSRKWDPQSLRDTVSFLSWESFGSSLHRNLQEAAREWKSESNPVIVEREPCDLRAD